MELLLAAFHPGPLWNHIAPLEVENPLGVAVVGRVQEAAGLALAIAFLLGIVISGTALVLRLHRATGDERQQVKWFVYFAALFLLWFVSQPFVRPVLATSPAVFTELYALAAAIAFAGGFAYKVGSAYKVGRNPSVDYKVGAALGGGSVA